MGVGFLCVWSLFLQDFLVKVEGLGFRGLGVLGLGIRVFKISAACNRML